MKLVAFAHTHTHTDARTHTHTHTQGECTPEGRPHLPLALNTSTSTPIQLEVLDLTEGLTCVCVCVRTRFGAKGPACLWLYSVLLGQHAGVNQDRGFMLCVRLCVCVCVRVCICEKTQMPMEASGCRHLALCREGLITSQSNRSVWSLPPACTPRTKKSGLMSRYQ